MSAAVEDAHCAKPSLERKSRGIGLSSLSMVAIRTDRHQANSSKAIVSGRRSSAI
ncbi:hypothetical protein RTCIAT899_PB02840 (plasmid) [Rhizobium tropici CIAT 899]|nr:hypothetical protein RTCIAT899_PB02840 [Rhizobium tropici CIAT 899]